MLAGRPHDTLSSASTTTGEAPGGGAAAGPGRGELDSARLLQGKREVLIRHRGECYRLRHTRNDKLILTK